MTYTGDPSVAAFIFGVFIFGPFISVFACWWANRLDRKAGLKPEAPTPMYAVIALPSLVLLLMTTVGTVVAFADEIIDPCSLIDPNESWAAYLMWLAAGCWW